ncbi:hypothetical protein M0R72_00320 [Candidatus Pacearchaeota archaeon]|jgi:hypothetical protein|nr:hypothetical protein [Candidatus Pacearchaeota archaeon]
MIFPKLTDLVDGECEYQLSPNDILALYNKGAIDPHINVDSDVIQWMELESARYGWKSLRWFFEGGSRGCFLRKFNDPLPTVKGCQEIALEKSVAELLTTAITRIAQHACRQGEISSRMWPSLSELPEPESWKFVGRKYAREIAIEIMKMYFSKGNFLTDLAKLAGRDSE